MVAASVIKDDISFCRCFILLLSSSFLLQLFKTKSPKIASWPGILVSHKETRTKVVLARKLGKQGHGNTPEHISNRPETTRQRANCWLNADTSVLASNIRRASRICVRQIKIPTKSENTIDHVCTDHVGADTNMLFTLAGLKWAPRLLYDVPRIITIKAPFVIISHSKQSINIFLTSLFALIST